MDHYEDALENGKIFIDDLNKIRLANPDVFESSTKLKAESEQFIAQLDGFNAFVHNIRTALEQVGRVADTERLKAMTLQNRLKRTEGGLSEEARQMQIVMKERQIELERLKVELQSLKVIEARQQENIQRLKSSSM